MVNVTIASVAMASGGSFVSWSVTSEATMVKVHRSLGAKSSFGSRVKVVGPPLTVAGWVPLESHEMSNHEFATSTGSLNVTCEFESTGTSTAPSLGVVAGDRRGGVRWHARDGDVVDADPLVVARCASVVMTRSWTIGWSLRPCGQRHARLA